MIRVETARLLRCWSSGRSPQAPPGSAPWLHGLIARIQSLQAWAHRQPAGWMSHGAPPAPSPLPACAAMQGALLMAVAETVGACPDRALLLGWASAVLHAEGLRVGADLNHAPSPEPAAAPWRPVLQRHGSHRAGGHEPLVSVPTALPLERLAAAMLEWRALCTTALARFAVDDVAVRCQALNHLFANLVLEDEGTRAAGPNAAAALSVVLLRLGTSAVTLHLHELRRVRVWGAEAHRGAARAEHQAFVDKCRRSVARHVATAIQAVHAAGQPTSSHDALESLCLNLHRQIDEQLRLNDGAPSLSEVTRARAASGASTGDPRPVGRAGRVV